MLGLEIIVFDFMCVPNLVGVRNQDGEVPAIDFKIPTRISLARFSSKNSATAEGIQVSAFPNEQKG
jgi:hypothetical protein